MAAVVPMISFGILIEELDEANQPQLKLRVQLELLERELRLMLAVLDHIESLEGPSEDMNRWAEEVRDVVRSAEDMIDTFMIISGKTRLGFYFNDVFLGSKLSLKIMRLMLRIDPLSKESKFLGIEKAEDKNQGEGAEHKATIMSFVITSVERGCARIFFEASNSYTFIHLSPLLLPFFPIHILPGIPRLSLVGRSTSHIQDLLRLHKQILNVSTECEGSLSREVNVISETNTIIYSLLEKTDFVLSEKFLFHPFAIREVKQVRQGIRCIYDILKDMKAVEDGDLDEREKVWMEWVSEICLPANYYIATFASER